MKAGSKALVVGATAALIVRMATATANPDLGDTKSHPVLASPASTRPLVAAFYYPWYGNPTFDGEWIHWQQNEHIPPQDIGSDYYPILGAYSVRDQAVLAQHMAWLRQARVDIIIVSWWGQGSYEDQVIPGLLSQAAGYGIQVAFHIEPYFGRSAAQLVNDVQYLYARYGSSPAFFRTTSTSRHSPNSKAKGLFFVYMIDHKYSGGPAVNAVYWQAAIDQIHALPNSSLVIVDKMDGAWIDAGHFDGEYSYASLDPWPDGWQQGLLGWANSLPRDAWFVPSVVPGYSANRVGYPPESYRPRDGGQTYDRQWRVALETGVTPKIVAITSFNEWHEGTQIEPAAEGMTDGQGYTYSSYVLGATQYLSATADWVEAMPQMLTHFCTGAVSITLKTENASRGLYQHDLEDGLTEPVNVGGREARQAITNPFGPARYIYFWVNDDFHYSAPITIQVSVEYYDTDVGSFRLEYDSTDPSWPFEGAYKGTPDIPFTGTNQWRTAIFDLPDAFLGNRQNGGADLRIWGSDTYYISRVMMTKPGFTCRYLYLPLLVRNR